MLQSRSSNGKVAVAAGDTLAATTDYRRLEAETERPKSVVDHRAAWDKLPTLLAADGVARQRVEAFAQAKHISVESLIALGTRVNVDRVGGVELAWGHSADFDGREIISALKFRPLGDKQRYAATPSTFVEPLVTGNRRSLDWFLAEGETDAARLYDLVGENAAIVLLPAGARTFKPRWADRIPRGATVHLCHDADEAGDQGADKAARIIGGRTVRVRPPDGLDWCDWEGSRDEFVRLVAEARADHDSDRPFSMPVHEFIAVERPTVASLILDSDGRPVIARNSLTLLGALGGAGKTTLFVELALHLAAGVDYLCFTIPEPVSTLLIENEGPEDMFSAKLAEKLASFPHELKARVDVCTLDWGGFSLANNSMREQLREQIAENEYDLVFGDPLDSLGIEGVGSPEDTRNFLALMKETGLHQHVAWWINTHPRKEESKEAINEIAGAWGGKPDAILLLKLLADDRSQLRQPKLRWAKRGKGPTLLLGFDVDTETFTYIGQDDENEQRDYVAEIEQMFAEVEWRTSREIASPPDKGGIGAARETVQAALEQHPDKFTSLPGNEVGRHANATCWNLASPQKPDTPHTPDGAEKSASGVGLFLEGSPTTDARPPTLDSPDSHQKPDKHEQEPA